MKDYNTHNINKTVNKQGGLALGFLLLLMHTTDRRTRVLRVNYTVIYTIIKSTILQEKNL